MDEEYTFQSQVQMAIKACGFEEDVLFAQMIDYAFQPFYGISYDRSTPFHFYSLNSLNEFESRIKEKITQHPELNDPKYNGIFMQIMRWLVASQFSNTALPEGLKYHLAENFENTLNDLFYIKDNPDSKEKLKGDMAFVGEKKEQFRNSKIGENLEEFWQLLDKELLEENELLLPKTFISKLENQLKKNSLIADDDNLLPVFSMGAIDRGKKINWKGSQQALMFLFYFFAEGPEYNNQSLYSFVAERFLVKDKPVTVRKLTNTYFNLMDTYFSKDRPALSNSLSKILDILHLAIRR